MRLIFAITLLAALTIESVSAGAKPIHIVVRVPNDTPASTQIFLAGSLTTVGIWKADGLKLKRQEDGTYAGDIDLDSGQTLEYKITRGDWSTVEKQSDGSERPNRTLTAGADTNSLAITVESWATGTVSENHPTTVVGTLKLHRLDSQALGQQRFIRVWLPPDYNADGVRRFAVLYMQDGQNCFDRATSAFGNEWEIDESITKLISEKHIPPLIVVGVDNGLTRRADEYTFDADGAQGGGKAASYAKFLLTEVKPFVDNTYRTEPEPAHTHIGGSSLGGLVSLEIVRRNPNTFSGVIAMSPALGWADESLTKAIDNAPGGLQTARGWLDIGAREGEPQSEAGPIGKNSQHYVDAARRLDAILTKHHIAHRFTIDDLHAAHNEPAWAGRFPQAISYLLNAKE